MLILRLDAPFGVFRTFTAGSFRPTAGFITPSAAYGLLLNIAGIEMRCDDGKSVATVIQSGLPEVEIALAARTELPCQQSLFQQLHKYTVGNNPKNDPENPGEKRGEQQEGLRRCKGNKFHIVPARRSFLSEIHAYIALRGNEELEELIVDGLAGKSRRTYGLPFLGDSNFLIDRLEPVNDPEAALWYETIGAASVEGVKENITRLTITIDRTNMANTRSALFAPAAQASREIPEKAWVAIAY